MGSYKEETTLIGLGPEPKKAGWWRVKGDERLASLERGEVRLVTMPWGFYWERVQK
jgi:hypothetical protein